MPRTTVSICGSLSHCALSLSRWPPRKVGHCATLARWVLRDFLVRRLAERERQAA